MYVFCEFCCRIIDEETREGAAVDPVEPEKVLGVSKENDVELKLVLTTHHHWFDFHFCTVKFVNYIQFFVIEFQFHIVLGLE